MSIEKNITRLFEEIESSKNSINEILSGSEDLLGGAPVRIPRDGAHSGQSGWASGNAWDIGGTVGTPVYALTDGQAVTFSDYGPNVIEKDGKKLFGQSFTVQSYNGLPSVYYTHLTGSPIRKGSEVSCGEFLGVIMDFPGSPFDHVHIGVESGSIKQFLNGDGTLKCASGKDITGINIDSSILGGAALGGLAIGGVEALGGQEDSTEEPEEFQFAGGIIKDKESDFEYAGSKTGSRTGIKTGNKKSERIKENIERIKKML